MPQILTRNFGPMHFCHDTGTWTYSIAGGFLQGVKAAANEAGNSCVDVSLPIEDELELGKFKGYSILDAEIQYVVGTANLDAAPTLALYRERVGSTTVRKTVDITAPAAMGKSQTTHNEKIVCDSLGNQPEFFSNEKVVADFAWDAANTSELSVNNLKVRYKIFDK